MFLIAGGSPRYDSKRDLPMVEFYNFRAENTIENNIDNHSLIINQHVM